MLDRPGNVNVFILYAAADRELKDELENHLSLLHHHGYIDVWHEGQIAPGEERDRAIGAYIEKAHLILLLISANFLAPDCYTKYEAELRAAYERQQRGEVKIIPVILRHCIWQLDILAGLSPLPQGGHPVRSTHWESPDLAFQNIVQALQQTAQELTRVAERVQQGAPPLAAAPAEAAEGAPQTAELPADTARDGAAAQLIADLFERLGHADREVSASMTAALVHPSLLRNGALSPTFRKRTFDHAHARLGLYRRPAQILSSKPTGRTRFGAGRQREEGEEVSYAVARTGDLGGLPGYVRVFFPAGGGPPTISGLGM